MYLIKRIIYIYMEIIIDNRENNLIKLLKNNIKCVQKNLEMRHSVYGK